MKIERTEVLYSGFETGLLLTVRTQDGQEHRRQVGHHGNAAAVLPYDRERRVAVLVLQHRAPMLYSGQDGPLLEVPAGLIEDEPADTTARREAMEEAGIRIAEMEPVAEFWSMPGVSTERLSLYLAPYSAADRVGKGGGLDSEGEHIEVVEIPLSELARMADAGTLLDMKTFVAVQTLRLKAPDLFD